MRTGRSETRRGGRHQFVTGGAVVRHLDGAAAPIVTGFIVGATNSFTNAFIVAGVILLVGIVSFVFVLGKIEPIPDPEPKHEAAALT